VQVVDVPVYHWYEYGDVPPDAADVNVSYWPLSIIEFDIVGFPAARTGRIVDVLVDVEVEVVDVLVEVLVDVEVEVEVVNVLVEVEVEVVDVLVEVLVDVEVEVEVVNVLVEVEVVEVVGGKTVTNTGPACELDSNESVTTKQ
jgi:hypothetical protein